jgi:hypothetical protein
MKPLKRVNKVELFHVVEDKKVLGNCSDLRGDCSDLRGDCSDLRGDCSGLRGNCSGLRGDCSDLRGDADLIPLHERKDRPDIMYWVEG